MGATRWVRAVAALAVAASLAACTPAIDVFVLSHDDREGRATEAGKDFSRGWIALNFQVMGLEGLVDAPGGEAYFQRFPLGADAEGVNVIGVLPGTDLADEYVVVGAHYDHVASCRRSSAADRICNGATDNATGVALVLQVARILRWGPAPPRRSVVFALWDAEEAGLLGSRHFVQAEPLVPLDDVVAYLNFDIMGANLLPSLTDVTFAVGAESGGQAFQDLVRDAAAPRSLQTELLSAIFGQLRSDYTWFLQAQIPTVFFTDSTGPCYHTVDDERAVVDHEKLDEQIATATALARELATRDEVPAFVPGQPAVVFDDAVAILRVVDAAEADRNRFTPEQQAEMTAYRDQLRAVVDAGPAAFDQAAAGVVVNAALFAVNLLTLGECDGFTGDQQLPPIPPWVPGAPAATGS